MLLTIIYDSESCLFSQLRFSIYIEDFEYTVMLQKQIEVIFLYSFRIVGCVLKSIQTEIFHFIT